MLFFSGTEGIDELLSGKMSLALRSRWHHARFLVFLTVLILYAAPLAAAPVIANRVLGQIDFVHNGPNIVSNAGLWTPHAVAVDRSVTPNRVYVADSGNHRVLGWRSIAALTNGSPADLVIGQTDFLSWSAECNNAAVTGATLCFPSDVAVDPLGNLYVVDQGNNRVLEYDDPFNTDTLPDMVFGQGGSFTSSACNLGGNISAATLCNPTGVGVDSAGNVYVADTSNSRVLEYDLPLATDVIADRVFGQANGFDSGSCNLGGAASAGTLCIPADAAVDAGGHLYIADAGNFRVLEYDTPLESSAATMVFGQGNDFTSRNNSCASFPVAGALCSPDGLALDNAGNLYISDATFSRVQEYNTPVASGSTTPNAVFGQPGFNSLLCNNGGVSAAGLCQPFGMATDSGNDLFVADLGNQRMLEYLNPLSTDPPNTSADLVLGQKTLTRNGTNSPGANSLYQPGAVALDMSVSPNRLYVADTNNSRILAWHSVAAFTNGGAADLVIGQPDLFSTGCNQNRVDGSGNSLPADNTLCLPAGVAVDKAGGLWVSDSGNFRVLGYDPPFASGMTANQAAAVVLGQHGDFTSRMPNNGGISATSMSAPSGLAIDPAGNLYVTDPVNNRALKFAHPATSDSAQTVFGQGGSFTGSTCNFDGACTPAGCSATADSLCGPAAVAVSAGGNLYIADTANNRVLQYPPGAAGNPNANLVVGQADFTAVACATMCQPQGVAVDASGNLYAADALNAQIKTYHAPLSDNPPAAVVIGTRLCEASQAGAGTLCGVSGIGLDSSGNLYAADSLDNRVLQYNGSAVPTSTPTPTPTPTPRPTGTPTATPTPAPGVPFIITVPGVIRSGSMFKITGVNFTIGSAVNFFVATASGPINTGPFKPVFVSSSELNVAVPAANPLGQGVAAVQVVNTDHGFAASNAVLSLLQGNAALGIPSITGINSALLAPDSTSPGVATANVQTVVVQGTVVRLQGSGFDTTNGVAVDLFCACTGGKVGPFIVNPGLNLTSAQITFNLPSSGPNAPVTGPGSFVVSNKGSDGQFSRKSNAVSVPIGQRISVTGVSQSGSRITVFGTGFCGLTVINLFNLQGSTVVDLGGLNPDGTPKIPLTITSSDQLSFTVPAAAKPGQAYVQALNPPFVPFTSSDNASAGAFVLH